MANNNEGGVSSKDYLKRLAEGSGNVDESGNFSIEVLRSALMSRYNIELPNIRQEGLSKIEVTEIEGFICNRSSHWFTIRKINDRYWNLNSTLERPEVISHFRLAAEIEALQSSGYSVFCVVSSLPPPCTNEAMMDQGLVSFVTAIVYFISNLLSPVRASSLRTVVADSLVNLHAATILVERRRFAKGENKCNDSRR